MNAKQRIFSIVSAEELLSRLSLREVMTICTEVMSDDELHRLMEMNNHVPEQKEFEGLTPTEASLKLARQISQSKREALIAKAKAEKAEEDLNRSLQETQEKLEQAKIELIQKIKQPVAPEPKPEPEPEPKPEPEPEPELKAKRGITVKDTVTESQMLSMTDWFYLEDIHKISQYTYNHISKIAERLVLKGKLVRSRDPNYHGKKYQYWVVRKPELTTKEPKKEEPKKEEPKKEEPKISNEKQPLQIKKGPKTISWKDLYEMPEVIECIFKDLYTRMHKCLENMGQYDLKELLEKNFPKLKESYDLGTNNVDLMVAGKKLMDFLTTPDTSGKPKKYDCSVIAVDNKGTYRAKPSEMKRYAKAKGWN